MPREGRTTRMSSMPCTSMHAGGEGGESVRLPYTTGVGAQPPQSAEPLGIERRLAGSHAGTRGTADMAEEASPPTDVRSPAPTRIEYP